MKADSQQTRLASLLENAAILGIDVTGIENDPDAVERRIGSYKMASRSNAASRGGFFKMATSLNPPEPVEIAPDTTSETG